jgi:hypothetical protein
MLKEQLGLGNGGARQWVARFSLGTARRAKVSLDTEAPRATVSAACELSRNNRRVIGESPG